MTSNEKKPITNDIAHASLELLETEMQNRYFSRYLKSSEAHAISERSQQYQNKMKNSIIIFLIACSLYSCGQKKEQTFKEEALELLDEVQERNKRENEDKLSESTFSNGVQEIMEWFDYQDPIVATYKNIITIRSSEDFNKLIENKPESVSAIYIDSYDTTIFIDDISVLENLEYLKIRSLDSVPNGFYNLEKLKVFISANDLRSKLDGKISNLQNLKYVKSSWTHVEFPPEISNLKNLEVLKLNNFNNNQPYKEIYNLPNLRTLWIDFSNESQLEGISNLKKLKILVTNKVSPEIGKLNLTGLNIASNNDLKYPQELSKLKELVAFKWQVNYSATSAPKFVANLKKLEYIEFRGCEKLNTIPKEYNNLTGLKRFDIYYNKSYTILEDHLEKLNGVIEIKTH